MKAPVVRSLFQTARSAAMLMAALQLVALAPSIVVAQNVDLVTLPKRDTVQLTIYNSEDITLVKEVRSLTVRRGENRLQFSWAGTLIDPTSVELRPLEQADKIEVADTVFPGQKPQHLIWNINSEFEGEALFEVSYFTSGLTWTMDYVAICDSDESEMSFRGHVRVYNNSGEDYEDAEVRLIVGKINLVEKIATLAQRRKVATPKPGTNLYMDFRKEAATVAIETVDRLAVRKGGEVKAKQVVKEGVSEYFMFSVEGTETIPNGWSKRMPAVQGDAIKFGIVYRLRSYQYGPRPVRFFTWKNDKENKLGDSPLPNGNVRVFRDNGRDGLSFLGQQKLEYVPIQAEIEVNLGADDLVVFQQRKTETRRSNFRFDPKHPERVIGWDEHQKWNAEIRNYHAKPIAFELRLQLAGDVELTPRSPTKAFNLNTVETKLSVAPRDRATYLYEATIHQAANAKQNRVQLKPAE